jgi:hypothetical protein
MNSEITHLKEQIDELRVQHNQLKELYETQMRIIKWQRVDGVSVEWEKCDTCELWQPVGEGEEHPHEENKWICVFCHQSLMEISEGTPPN